MHNDLHNINVPHLFITFAQLGNAFGITGSALSCANSVFSGRSPIRQKKRDLGSNSNKHITINISFNRGHLCMSDIHTSVHHIVTQNEPGGHSVIGLFSPTKSLN